LTLRTHDLPEFFGGAGGIIKAQSDAAFARLIARFIGFYRETLFNPHWGEQAALMPDNRLDIGMSCQGLGDDEVKAAWRPFFDWVKASPQDYAISEGFEAYAHGARDEWRVAGRSSLIPDARDGAVKNRGWWKDDSDQIGVFIHGYDSLWLPASLLQEDRQKSLTEALFAASRHKKVQLHFNKGLAGASAEVLAAARRTATNPDVVQAFVLVIIADGEQPPAYPGMARVPLDLAAARKDARAIDLAAAELRKIAPHAGSYVSESNYFNRSWQSAYWGENYSRLRAIKTKYDPEGLFVVHHGVGSEDWSADGFTRLARD
jgi:hypothetical protein